MPKKLDKAIKQKASPEDLKRIIRGLLLDVTHLGQDLAGAEYKLSYMSDHIPVEAMREWVNWAGAIQRELADLERMIE